MVIERIRSLVPSPTSALHFIPDRNKMEGGSGAGNATRGYAERVVRFPVPFSERILQMSRSKMASKIPKLHAVTLIRSGIRRPYWERRTLDALGLTKLHKTIYHKNTPSVNGLIKAVKHMVEVRPLVVRTDFGNSPCSSMDGFVTSKGEIFVSEPGVLTQDVDGINPRNRLRRKSSRLWAQKKKTSSNRRR